MFRELVRKKQEIPREECIEILKEQKRGVLSVIRDDGYPYGMPLNHYYDERDGKIYFHGGKAGHRLDALAADPRVSYCVMDCLFGPVNELSTRGFTHFTHSGTEVFS